MEIECQECSGTGKIETEHKLEVGQQVTRSTAPFVVILDKPFEHGMGPAWRWKADVQFTGPNWDLEKNLTPVIIQATKEDA